MVSAAKRPSARKTTGGRALCTSKWIHHQVPFKDHNGNPAIMAWHAPEMQRVPTLPAWIFYMINPETPQDFDARKFEMSFQDQHNPYYSQSFRFEFFFLPGATPEECVTHYRNEVSARGTIWSQVRKAWAPIRQKRAAEREKRRRDKAMAGDSTKEPSSDDDTDDESEYYDRDMDLYYAQDDAEPQPNTSNEQRLPGLPWAKGDEVKGYRQWLLMCTDEVVEWGPSGPGYNEQALNIRVARFDPVPLEYEEGEAVRWDPMEHPIQVKQDPDLWFIIWANDRGHESLANHAIYATTHATELGWETW